MAKVKKHKANERGEPNSFNRISGRTNALFTVLFTIIALICIIPALLVVAISLSSEDSVTRYGYQLIPKIVSVDGYSYLLKQGTLIMRALGVSVAVTVGGTVLGTLLTTLMGYVLSRRDYKLNGLMTMIVFIPMVFNGGLVSTYFINSQFLGLKNTLWALILPLSVSSFNVVICRTFFKANIPEELVESAKVDGASQFTIFSKIVLPVSLPVVAAIGLFLCFNYWNDWYQSLLYIDNPQLYSLQALLNSIMTNINMLAQNAAVMGVSMADMVANMPKEAARMAIVVIIVTPIACTYPFFQKYFISGLTVGAVKG